LAPRKIHRAIFSGAGNYYPLFHSAALLSLLFPTAAVWHRGCNNPCQTKWRASGRFRMDLTARDPSKVPRCILSGTAGVSEAQAERESAREILSALLREGSLPLSGTAGVNEAQAERESAREIPERSFYAKDLCLRAGIIAGVSKAGVR